MISTHCKAATPVKNAIDFLTLHMLGLALAMTLGAGLGANSAFAQQAQPRDARTEAGAAAQTPVSPRSITDPNYRLGPGDKIRIITFGEEALSGEFNVSGSGAISLPLIGEQNALGLTTSKLQSELESAFKAGYLTDPHISVEVLTYRPYYILGEVNKPGELPYTNALTVMNAVATANGFTYRANTKYVFIKHAGETKEKRYPLTTDLSVSPGDTIRIEERIF